MDPLNLVRLSASMKYASGTPEVKIGLIEGPVVTAHSDLAREHFRAIPGNSDATCAKTNSTARLHGTFSCGHLNYCNRSQPLVNSICIADYNGDL
jgi:hypothetical protein